MARLRAQFVLPFTAAPCAAADAGPPHSAAPVLAEGAAAVPTAGGAGSGPGSGSGRLPDEAAGRSGEGEGLSGDPAGTRAEAAGTAARGSHAGLGSDGNPFAVLVRDSRGARDASGDAAAGAGAAQDVLPLT